MTPANVSVLLDTDIGSDVDDAICLSYLLGQRRCELLGITTVTGQPHVRAALADAVCRASGRTDVPVHAGTEAALLSTSTPQPNVPHAVVLDRFEHRSPESFPANRAVDFLHETILSHPHEITLLAVGPLTNIALLFATYPESAALLRALFIMGGSFSNRSFSNRTPGAGPHEWNLWCDPYAASAVYGIPVREHASVGIDVTRHCTVDADRFASRVGSLGGPWNVVAAITATWDARTDPVVFHDPLTAVSLFRPDVCTWSRGRVTVELASERFRGVASFDANHDESPHTIAADVDVDAFFAELFSVCQPLLGKSGAELGITGPTTTRT